LCLALPGFFKGEAVRVTRRALVEGGGGRRGLAAAGTATRKVQSKLTRLLAQGNMCKVQNLSLQDMLSGAMVRPMQFTRVERQVN
jgi:hypothetical protein